MQWLVKKGQANTAVMHYACWVRWVNQHDVVPSSALFWRQCPFFSMEKVVLSLGGLKNVGQVVSEPNRRLELRFRPQDIFCKPTCGERHQCSCKYLPSTRYLPHSSASPPAGNGITAYESNQYLPPSSASPPAGNGISAHVSTWYWYLLPSFSPLLLGL